MSDVNTPAEQRFSHGAAQVLALHLVRWYTSPGAVAACIQEQLGQDLPVDPLAHQADLSWSYFARLFRAATEATPHQCVRRLRVERARQLLDTTDLPLAHVATESGFADQSHFTKRQLGVTPRA